METVLLVCDDDKLFDITKRITEGKYKLVRCNYHSLKTNKYPFADVVIMYFDRTKMKKSTFEFIVKVKGKLGHLVPILAVIEGGNAQDIFSVLEAGSFDYIEVTDNLQKYAKKIEELVLWRWYLRKYEFEKKRQ